MRLRCLQAQLAWGRASGARDSLPHAHGGVPSGMQADANPAAARCASSSPRAVACPQGLNLLQSIQLPFALIPMLTFTGSSALMGCLATRGLGLAAAWAVALIVICVNMTAVAQVASAWVSARMRARGSLARAALPRSLQRCPRCAAAGAEV